MGMDVFGENPVSEAGEYFRASVWTWPYFRRLSQHVGADTRGWEYNGGNGLSSTEECIALGNAIDAFVQGATDQELAIALEDADADALAYVKKRVPEFTNFLRACGGFRNY